MRQVLRAMVIGILIVGGGVGCAGSASGAPMPSQATMSTPGSTPARTDGQPQPGTQPRQATGRVVSVAPVVEGRVRLVFTYSATVQPRWQVNVSPKSSGRIERLLVDVGSEVKEGDPIATLESGALRLAVQQAEANLKSAQARLATVTAGGRREDVASAEAALAAARARLNQVRNAPVPAELQAARSAVDSARANLASAEARVETVRSGPTQAEWGAALAAVDSATANLRSAETKLAQLKSGPTAAELQAAQAAVEEARAKLITAQDIYETAQDNLAQVSSRVTSVSHAQQAYQSARAAYDAAVQKLSQLQAGPTPADLQAAQSAYDSARASLDAATARVDQMKRGPTAQEIQQAQSAVDSARAALSSAEAKLAQLEAGPTADELAVAEAAVTQAEQTLALKRQPYTAQDVQTAQAAVEVATVALGIAKAQLADANLVAPFSGTVTQRFLSPGALASPSTPVVALASFDAEIVVTVEEARLSRLKPGLHATISAPAYPGESFAGKVASISPSADARSHTFTMKVVPDNTDGKLKSGMYTEVKVTAEERASALLVPRDAITQRGGKDVVFVVADGRAEMREVVTGLPENNNVEILSGVKAGEQAIVVGHGGLNDGDPVRVAGGAGGQQPEQPRQQRPDAPAKSR